MADSNQVSQKFFHRFRWAYLFFLIISAFMLRCAKIFETKSGMEHPQFGFSGYNSDSFGALTSYFTENFPAYKYFFYADMFFMLAICWMIYTLYQKLTLRSEIWGKLEKWIPRFFITFGGLSIAADIFENYTYLTGNYFSFAASLKMALCVILIFGFLLFVFVNSEKKIYQKFLRFVRSSYISLIILVLIAFGLTLLPQGATLIVHLFKSKVYLD